MKPYLLQFIIQTAQVTLHWPQVDISACFNQLFEQIRYSNLLGHNFILVLVLISHINVSTLLGCTLSYNPMLFLFDISHIFHKNCIFYMHGSQSQLVQHSQPKCKAQGSGQLHNTVYVATCSTATIVTTPIKSQYSEILNSNEQIQLLQFW